MALDEKRIETRGWATSYRGLVAIHAAKGLADPICNEEGLRLKVAEQPFRTALNRHGIVTAEQLPRASILATARLVACLPTLNLADRIRALPALDDFRSADFEGVFGFYGPGRYAWFFTDLHVFDKPVPWRGAQQLWPLEEEELLHMLAITGQPEYVTKPSERSAA
jgi:hypothetical protein